MAIDPRTRTVDTDEELLWKEIKDAVKHVELNHGLSYDLERGTKGVGIWYEAEDVPQGGGCIRIEIYEVEPKQPTLLVP